MLYFQQGKDATYYMETNATWKIQGLCLNAKDQTPIKNASVTACVQGAIRSAEYNELLTNIVTKTDAQGHFETTFVGGSVRIYAQAEGYRIPELWEKGCWRYYTKNGMLLVETNVILCLDPI